MWVFSSHYKWGLFIIVSLLYTGCIYNVNEAGNKTESSFVTINIAIPNDTFENLNRQIYNREYKPEATIKIIHASDTFQTTAQIKIHGGTSREHPKKSYRLFFDNNLKKPELLFSHFPETGRSEGVKQVILNAATVDYSRIRNFLSMYATHLLGGLTPRVGFTKVYVNDKYHGFYSTIERINDNFIEEEMKHSGFDLLKAQNWGADLYEKNGTNSFELKYGNESFLKQFSKNLSNHNYSAKELYNLTDSATLFGFIQGNYYTADVDVFGKNYYFSFDKVDSIVSFIRWDGDATFGRSWNGSINETPNPLTHIIHYNALYAAVSKFDVWKEDFETSLLQQFKNKNLTTTMLKKIDELEQLLQESILEDYTIWFDITMNHFNSLETYKGHWDYISPKELLHSEFMLLRKFVTNREKEIKDELKDF